MSKLKVFIIGFCFLCINAFTLPGFAWNCDLCWSQKSKTNCENQAERCTWDSVNQECIVSSDANCTADE